jgi:hypothetical protein
MNFFEVFILLPLISTDLHKEIQLSWLGYAFFGSLFVQIKKKGRCHILFFALQN